MTSTSLRLLPNTALTVVLIVAAIFACSEDKTPDDPSPAPVHVQAEWQSVRSLPGHEVHVTQHQLACDTCHTLADTTFDKPSPERCRTCHEQHSSIEHASSQASERFGKSVGADCTLCHAFTQVRPEAAVGSPWDCQRCHSGHVDSAPGAGSGPQGSTTSDGNTDLQANTPPANNALQINMAEHGSMAKTSLVGHSSANCRSCHAPHEQPPVKVPDCSTCHADITLSHGDVSHGFTVACGQCHTEVHAPAGAAKSCQACHDSHKPVVASSSALFAGGHDTCTTCHVPHDFGKGVKGCDSCHTNHAALAAERVNAHNDCRNCHTPHNIRANPNQACKSCHSSLKNDHPVQAGQHECTTCHQGHPSAARPGKPDVSAQGAIHGRSTADAHHSTAKACTSCHNEAADDRAFHGQQTACIQCHKPHQFNVSMKQRHLCQACHAEQLTQCAQAKGHHDCQACHTGLPHDVTIAPAPCDSCHKGQALAVNAGHQACNQCHEPHSGSVSQTCSSCHQTQHQTAPAGHRNCQSCHDAHSGRQRSNVSCSTCHATQAGAVHGDLKTGCTTCHRPHGPQGLALPPDCVSCHVPSELPSLHRVTQHQTCAQCHSAHDSSPFGQKDACLSCHTDKTNHFPTTERCSSCHLFKGL